MIRHYHQHKVQKFLKTLTHIVFNIKLICCWEPTPIQSLGYVLGQYVRYTVKVKRALYFQKIDAQSTYFQFLHREAAERTAKYTLNYYIYSFVSIVKTECAYWTRSRFLFVFTPCHNMTV